MKQIQNFGDKRQLSWCVYCGRGSKETRDHVPSKILLDRPFPKELPIVPACRQCNFSFATDEEYLACLVECTLAGSTDPDHVKRERIRDVLIKRPSLRVRLSAAKTENNDGTTLFMPEIERVNNVVLKLARGHAAYELNEPQFDEPASIAAVPLILLSHEQRDNFEASLASSFLPEAGSRAMQRLFEGHDMDESGWITVQKDRYRFLASIADGICIRMVLSEYLACEVVWNTM